MSGQPALVDLKKRGIQARSIRRLLSHLREPKEMRSRSRETDNEPTITPSKLKDIREVDKGREKKSRYDNS